MGLPEEPRPTAEVGTRVPPEEAQAGMGVPRGLLGAV